VVVKKTKAAAGEGMGREKGRDDGWDDW
jgi:hypothetical protein